MLIEITPEESKLLLELLGELPVGENQEVDDLYYKLDYQINAPGRY